MSALNRTWARRRARSAAGMVAVPWFGVVMWQAFKDWADHVHPPLTWWFLSWVPIVFGTYAVVYLVAALSSARRPVNLFRLAQTHALEGASLVWPAIAGALFGPLTLHALLWLTFATLLGGPPIRAFNGWLAISAPLTLPAHIALAICSAAVARDLARAPLWRDTLPTDDGASTIITVTLVALIPGVLLVGIPPLIVALTATAIVPRLYRALRRTADSERTRLREGLPDDLAQSSQAALLDAAAPDEVHRYAISVLVRAHDPATSMPLLAQFLEMKVSAPTQRSSRRCQAIKMALGLLSEQGPTPPIRVCSILARHPDEEIALSSIQFLSQSVGHEVQASLLEVLDARTDKVRLEAIRALGDVGTRDVVVALSNFAARTSHAGLRKAAKAAVKLILGRANSGAGPAALSLAMVASSDGALSPTTPQVEARPPSDEAVAPPNSPAPWQGAFMARLAHRSTRLWSRLILLRHGTVLLLATALLVNTGHLPVDDPERPAVPIYTWSVLASMLWWSLRWVRRPERGTTIRVLHAVAALGLLPVVLVGGFAFVGRALHAITFSFIAGGFSH